MPRLAGALHGMQGVVGKAVELAGEYKGLLKNEWGLGRASIKAVNEIGDKSTQRISNQARNIAQNSGQKDINKAYNNLVAGSNKKIQNMTDKFGKETYIPNLQKGMNDARLKRYAAASMENGNLTQKAFDKAYAGKQLEAGARTVKNATQEYFLDPLKAFKNSTGEAKSLAGKQAAARIGTAAVGLGAAGAVATNEL